MDENKIIDIIWTAIEDRNEKLVKENLPKLNKDGLSKLWTSVILGRVWADFVDSDNELEMIGIFFNKKDCYFTLPNGDKYTLALVKEE